MGESAVDQLEKLHDSFIMVGKSQSLDAIVHEAIVNATSSVVVDMATGIIIRATPLAGVMLGYTPEELKGMSIHELVPERLRESHKLWFEQYKAAPMHRTIGSRGRPLVALHKDRRDISVDIALCSVKVNGLHLAIAIIIPLESKPTVSVEVTT